MTTQTFKAVSIDTLDAGTRFRCRGDWHELQLISLAETRYLSCLLNPNEAGGKATRAGYVIKSGTMVDVIAE